MDSVEATKTSDEKHRWKEEFRQDLKARLRHHVHHHRLHLGPRGFLRFYTLRLLNEKPRSGYELMAEIERRTFGAWRPTSGSIYPMLMEMEDVGEIEEERTSESGERGKRIYRITSKGEESLKEWETRKRELRDKAFKWRAFWRELYEPNLLESTDEVETSISRLAKAVPGAKDLDEKDRRELQDRLLFTKQELGKIIDELQSENGPDR